MIRIDAATKLTTQRKGLPKSGEGVRNCRSVTLMLLALSYYT